MRKEITRVRQHGTHVTMGDGAAAISAIRNIVSRQQYAKVNGVMVDLFSASAIIKVYDALNDGNKAKFAALPVSKMASVAFHFVK